MRQENIQNSQNTPYLKTVLLQQWDWTTSPPAFPPADPLHHRRGLKSFNRWWNKEKADLQSIYDKQGKQGIEMVKRWPSCRRSIKIKKCNQQLHESSGELHPKVKYCLANRIGNIVIGELNPY